MAERSRSPLSARVSSSISLVAEAAGRSAAAALAAPDGMNVERRTYSIPPFSGSSYPKLGLSKERITSGLPTIRPKLEAEKRKRASPAMVLLTRGATEDLTTPVSPRPRHAQGGVAVE
jgi:hypothetical protein